MGAGDLGRLMRSRAFRMVVDETLVGSLRAALEREPDVVFGYLFGSHANGTATALSDVDVAVYLRPGSPVDARGVMVRLPIPRDTHVDVVILNTAPLTLAYETLKGRLLLSRDEDARVDFETSLTHRYLDRAYYMRRHLEAFAERMLERGYS